MAITKAQARKVRQPVLSGEILLSVALSASPSVEIIELGNVASKITVQSSGDLAGTVEFSVDGVTFASSTAFTATTLVSFSTHLIRVVKITRVSGSGKLHMVAV